MEKNQLFSFLGVLKENEEFFIRGVDINKEKSEYCYTVKFLFKMEKLKKEDIYIKYLTTTKDEIIFWGEKDTPLRKEIYLPSSDFEKKLSKKYAHLRYSNRKDEEKLKLSFSFLLEKYGFKFAKNDLGNAVDKSGKFFFYGPVYCYSIYNENICLNIINLVQRQEYDLYVTREYRADQVYIRNGVYGYPAYNADNFAVLAEQVKQAIETSGEICGIKVFD